ELGHEHGARRTESTAEIEHAWGRREREASKAEAKQVIRERGEIADRRGRRASPYRSAWLLRPWPEVMVVAVARRARVRVAVGIRVARENVHRRLLDKKPETQQIDLA
ncbi:MAG: hypothetical protein QUU85_09345, partial [Candidatus Eisenbacteria bacterium]|nr:hypothetical protein [Candidatus Eisenbacteria bacterium]